MTDLRLPALGLLGCANLLSDITTCSLTSGLWQGFLPNIDDLLEVSYPMIPGLNSMSSAGSLVTRIISNSLDEELAVDSAANIVANATTTNVLIFLPGQTIFFPLQFYYGGWNSLMDQQMNATIVHLFAHGAISVITFDGQPVIVITCGLYYQSLPIRLHLCT